MRKRGSWPLVLVLCSPLLACGGDGQPGATTGGTGGTGSAVLPTTDVATVEMMVGAVTTDDSVGVDTSGGGALFILEPDGALEPVCDLWEQDCPEGEKCVLWAADGGDEWNAIKCVPVTGDAQPGEACMMEGSELSGVDDCREGALCWDVDAELHGICVTLCDVDLPSGCPDEGFTCKITADVFNVCTPSCDLLLQDCPNTKLCLPNGNAAFCELDASGAAGAAFDPCEFANTCDAGLVCAESMSAVECDPSAGGCCTPMCDLGAINTCPGVGQSCAALFEPGAAPPKYVEVGYCTVPV